MSERTIHHYEAEFYGYSGRRRVEHKVPPGTIVRSAALRGDKIVVYVEKPGVENYADEKLTLETFFTGTGHIFDVEDGSWLFVDTVKQPQGGDEYFWHVYARIVS